MHYCVCYASKTSVTNGEIPHDGDFNQINVINDFRIARSAAVEIDEVNILHI